MTSPESLRDISPSQDAHVPTYDMSPRNNPPPQGVVSPVELSLSNTAQSFEIVHADTRVMSPSENNQRAPLSSGQDLQITPFNQQTHQSHAAWNMHLSGYQAFCVVCNQYAQEPSICANCGAFGHVDCLGMTPLSGYFFCFNCFEPMKAEWRKAQQDEEIRKWRDALITRLSDLRSIAIKTAGCTAFLGATAEEH